ncbi:predicted protein, partial [Ostreococcus lucimarinus CCE9901]
VTIDRPRALNALNRDAVERLHELFQRAERDDAAACYLLRGHGSRAFCAGGDVRAVREMVVRGDVDGAIAFFDREFALNAALHALRKPSACVWNGVVMGGGAGLSCYCPVRVATDATVFAMPECAIGLYPDVGAGWFLNALCGHAYATCLSLTGARVRGIDCKRIGLATHYVTMEVWDRETEKRVNALERGASVEDLARAAASGERDEPAATSYLTSERGRAMIDEVFGNDAMSLDDITREIARKEDAAESEAERAFFAECRESVAKASPTSLGVSLELMRRSRGKSLEWVLAMDNALIVKFIHAPDFRRGVEAVLIDKVGAPPPGGWMPA